MITREDYFRDPQTGKDRRVEYFQDFGKVIEDNADNTIAKANLLLAMYRQDTGDARPRKVNSGWRPPSVNAKTKNASPTSAHMDADGIDLFDYDDEALDNWLLSERGDAALVQLDLYHEHPRTTTGENATHGWAHVQTVPTRSKNRHFKAR